MQGRMKLFNQPMINRNELIVLSGAASRYPEGVTPPYLRRITGHPAVRKPSGKEQRILREKKENL